MQANITDKIGENILNKILTNQIQQYIERILYHNQVGLILEMQEFFSIRKLPNVVVYVQLLSRVRLCTTHGLQHTRLPCPSLSPRVCSDHVHWLSDDIQLSHPLLPLLIILKAIYKPTGNIILKQWKAESISYKIRSKTKTPLSPLLLNTVLQVLAISQTRKRNKRIQIGREEVKLSLFADVMILYIENYKVFMRKLL